VACVDKYYFEAALKNVKDRPLVDTCALNSHVSTAFGSEPIQQTKQIIGHSREGKNLLPAMLNETGDNSLSMNVQATAAIVNYLHCKLLAVRA
jgi:hypothetical protein